MALIQQIEADLKAALKAGRQAEVNVLRLVVSSLHNEQIKLGHTPSETEAEAVLRREAKQRQDSVAAFAQGQRTELAEAERQELAIIDRYLPAQLDEAGVTKLIDEVITELAPAGPQATGQVIGAVMKRAEGQADGSLVARLVKEKLGA